MLKSMRQWKKAEEIEIKLIEEISQDENVDTESQAFWSNMKKLLDVKFDNFEQALTIKMDQMIKNEVNVNWRLKQKDI